MSYKREQRIPVNKVVLLEVGIGKIPITRHIQTTATERIGYDELRKTLDSIGFLNFGIITWNYEVLTIITFEED